MKLTMHVTARKPLVDLVSEFAGEDAVYLRAPTYAYRIGEYTVTRGGDLLFPDDLNAGALHELYETLAGGGYFHISQAPFSPLPRGGALFMPIADAGHLAGLLSS